MKKRTFDRLSGAKISVRIFQISSLLLLPYILVAAGSYSLFLQENFFSFLFRLGLESLPRLEVLLLSYLYEGTLSEVLVYLAAELIALAWGVIAGRLLASKKTQRAVVYLIAALIALDLILRLLPLHINELNEIGWRAAGFAVRLAGLGLIAAGWAAERKGSKTPDPENDTETLSTGAKQADKGR